MNKLLLIVTILISIFCSNTYAHHNGEGCKNPDGTPTECKCAVAACGAGIPYKRRIVSSKIKMTEKYCGYLCGLGTVAACGVLARVSPEQGTLCSALAVPACIEGCSQFPSE